MFDNTTPQSPEKGEYPVFSGLKEYTRHTSLLWANDFRAEVETLITDTNSETSVRIGKEQFEEDQYLELNPDDDLDALHQLTGMLIELRDQRKARTTTDEPLTQAHTEGVDWPSPDARREQLIQDIQQRLHPTILGNLLVAVIQLYHFMNEDERTLFGAHLQQGEWIVPIPLDVLSEFNTAVFEYINSKKE